MPFHPRKIAFEAGATGREARYAGRVIAILSMEAALREEAGLEDDEGLDDFYRDELDRLVGGGGLEGTPHLYFGWVAAEGTWMGTDGAERAVAFRQLQSRRRGDDLV